MVTGGDNGGLGILLLANSFNPESKDGIEEPAKGEEREVLLIPAAHAAAITAVIYLRSSPLSSCYCPWHFFATISTDQRVKIWRIRTRPDSTPPADDDKKGNNAKTKKVNVIEVDKVREMHSIVCDAAASGAAVVHHYPTPQQADDDEEEEKAEGQQQLGEGNIVLIVAGIGVEFFDLGRSLQIEEG